VVNSIKLQRVKTRRSESDMMITGYIGR